MIFPVPGWGTVVRATPRWSGLRNIPGPALPLTAFDPPANSYNPGGILPAVRHLQIQNQAHGVAYGGLIFLVNLKAQ